MNIHLTLPASTIRKITQLPLIRLLVGLLLVFIPVTLGQMVVIHLSISKLWRSILVMVLTVPAAFTAYYIFVHFIERRKMAELSLSGAAYEIAWGIVIGVLFSGSVMGILWLTGSYKVLGANSVSVLLSPLFFAVSSAVFEEILFRGVLFRMIEQSFGSWIALVISAAIFGGLHLINKNATIVGVTAIMLQAGFTMGAAFILTRRLWLPIGIHFAWNFTQVGVFASAVSGNEAVQGFLRSTLTGPDWITGGTFGIEASMVTVVLGLIVGVFFLTHSKEMQHHSLHS